MSQFTPEPRSEGPVTPQAIASAAESGATCFVRAIQIGFFVSSDSYSSMCLGISRTNFSQRSMKPSGMSMARPPTRK
jgi:hypothetical protein